MFAEYILDFSNGLTTQSMRVHDALYGSGICEGKIPYRYMKQIMSTPNAQYESVTTWSQCNVQSFFPC